MLISGRAERVVVVAGDNGSGATLLPWLGENRNRYALCLQQHELIYFSCQHQDLGSER